MKKKKEVDPIVAELKKFNTPNRRRHRHAVHWRGFYADNANERMRKAEKAEIKPFVTMLKRKFRNRFRRKGSKSNYVSIEYTNDRGFYTRGEHNSISLHLDLSYVVYRNRWRIERSFYPACMEDLEVESWLLFSVLNACGKFTDSRMKTCDKCQGTGLDMAGAK